MEITKSGQNTCSFNVTISHEDTGWDHYVNKWEILDEDGSNLGTRTLYHPHVDEQPFTRSLSGVKISEGITSVTVRAHDSIHEYNGKTITLELP